MSILPFRKISSAALLAGTTLSSTPAFSACDASGSSSDDIISCNGSSAALATMAGDDHVTNTGDFSASIDLGEGDDRLTMQLSTASFTGASATGGAEASSDTLELVTDNTVSINLSAFNSFEVLEIDGDGMLTTQSDDTDFSTIVLNGNSGLTIGSMNSWTASVAGGAGDNKLTVNGSLTGAEVKLGAGSDNFMLNSGGSASFELFLEDGDDFVTLSDTLNGSISGGDGNDTITVNSGADISGDVDLGAGNDTANVNTDLDKAIVYGEGDDTLNVASGATLTGDQNMGDGNDTVHLQGDVSGDVDGGAGDDNITIADSASVTGDVTGGEGNDALDLSGDVTGAVDLGAGDDSFTVNDENASVGGAIDLGEGADTANINENFGQPINYGAGDDTLNVASGATLTGDQNMGEGNDSANISGAVTGGLDGGAGNDSFTVEDGASVSGDITGGDGNDLMDLSGSVGGNLDLGAGDDTFTVNNDNASIGGNVDLGAGADTVNINENFDQPINYGAGDDTLNVASGATLTGDQNMGEGNDSAVVNGALTGSFDGGSGDGSDSLTVGNGGSVSGDVVLGDGEDNLSVASGASIGGGVNLGDGSDTVSIAGDVTGAIDTGAGNDKLTIEQGGNVDGAINLGDGDNEVSFNEDYDGDVTFGTGNNTVNIGDGATLTSATPLGGDNVTINNGGTLAGDLELGDGDNEYTVDLSGDSNVTGSNNGGAGTDTFGLDSTNGSGTYEGSLGEGYEVLGFSGGNSATLDNNQVNNVESVSIAGDGTVAGIGAGTTLIAANGVSGDSNGNTLQIDGHLQGDADLGEGADTFSLNLDTGSYQGQASGGEGHDTLAFASDGNQPVPSMSQFSDFEDLALNGTGEFTLSDAITFDKLTLGAETDLALTNGGVFNGDIHDGSGDNAISLAAGSTINGNINFSGGNDVLTLNGGALSGNIIDSDLSNGNSQVQVNEDFSLTGNVTVNEIDVANAKTLSMGPSSSITTEVATSGPYNWQVEIDENGNHGFWQVVGDNQGLNLTDVTVSVLVDQDAELTDGAELKIGTGKSPLIGTTGSQGQTLTKVDANSYLFDFYMADGGQTEINTAASDNTDLFLKIDRSSNTLADAGSSADSAGLGAALDGALQTNANGLGDVKNKLYAAGNKDEVAAIIQKLMPSEQNPTYIASKTFGQAISNASALGTSGFSQGANLGAGTFFLKNDNKKLANDIASEDQFHWNAQPNIWLTGLAQKSKFDTSNGGFSANLGGVIMGGEYEVTPEGSTLGGSIAYARNSINALDANRTKTKSSLYNVAIHGSHILGAKSRVSGDFGLGLGRHGQTRHDVGGVSGLNAEADYNSYSVGTHAKFSHDLVKEERTGFALTPHITARYFRNSNQSYTEKGAGGAGLKVNSSPSSSFELGTGAVVKQRYHLKSGAKLDLNLGAHIDMELGGRAGGATSQLIAGGNSFKTTNTSLNRNTVKLGVGLDYISQENMNLSAHYDYNKRGELSSHAASAKLSLKF